MAESNAAQVILTDDGIKIIKAQNTADNAAGGVANLNDPNLMSVIEKQTQASQYAGLTSQYNVILARAKEANVSTPALATAYTNLNTFMAAILTDTTKASDVDRNTYKSLTDAYNTALSNVQNALKDAYNADIDNMQSSVSVASQAASSAAIVASQAAVTGNNASQVASRAASAASQASADYTALSSGVKDGSVVHITTKTVIDDAVIGTAEIANAAITDAQVGNVSANKLTAGTIDFNTITGKNINASNITTGTISTDRLNVGQLSALSADLGNVTTGSLTGVNIVAKTFSTPNGSFTTDASGAITAKNMTLTGGTLTSPTINASTINGSTINGGTMNTPNLNLGLNGIFTEDYDYTQDTSYFLPKKASGKLTFTHGVLQSDGHMQTYSPNGNNWGGINNNQEFVSGLSNDTWTELGPGYLKLDMIGQSKGNVINRLYADPTGLYYNNGRTDSVATHISSSVYTQSVVAPTVVTNSINLGSGLRLNMVPDGNDWGLAVGLYGGKQAVLSDFIYNFTTSTSSNVYITRNGHLGRATSASKYKLNINNPKTENTLGDRLLNVHLATWNDKYAVENYARSLSDGSESENLSIKEHYGLIAEQLRDAGLNMFLEYGSNNEIEGIQYDRAWIPLLPVIRRLKDKVLDYEQRISKLEAKINE